MDEVIKMACKKRRRRNNSFDANETTKTLIGGVVAVKLIDTIK